MTITIRQLRDVCVITMGQAPDGESYNDKGRGLPLIAGAGDFGVDFPQVKKFTSAPTKVCAVGDIIISIRATIGTKVLSDGAFCLGRGVAGLRATSELDTRYLWHWLGFAEPTLSAKGRGATFPQVSRNDIGVLEIPVPSREEQRRIASIMDKADILRRKRRSAIEHVKSLGRVLVDAAYMDAAGTALLGDLCEVQGGLQVTRSRAGLPIEVPYLRVANVYRDRLDTTEIKKLRVSRPELERTTLLKGDILFVEGHGNADEIGRCAVWDGSVAPCVHQNHIIRARPVSPDLNTLTLSRFLNSPVGRRHIFSRGKTTSGLNTISVADVKAIPVSILLHGAQEQLGSSLEKIDRIHAAHRTQLDELDSLFCSLQSRAFSGQL